MSNSQSVERVLESDPNLERVVKDNASASRGVVGDTKFLDP